VSVADVRFLMRRFPVEDGGVLGRLYLSSRYELVRVEDGEPETLSQGHGLGMRLRIGRFLRETLEIGGSDAAAAREALRVGWVRVAGDSGAAGSEEVSG
jgi:hypothetical protein